jgi:hypothetical protein
MEYWNDGIMGNPKTRYQDLPLIVAFSHYSSVPVFHYSGSI